MESKKRIRVYVADRIHEDGIRLLSQNFKLAKLYGLTNDGLLIHIGKDSKRDYASQALIVRSTRRISDSFLKELSQSTGVKAICTVSSGYDNIDVISARKYKIRVFNVPFGNYVSAAEHTFALLLAINKKLQEKHNEIIKKKFISVPGVTTELFGKTIGIIGVGKVGSYVAKLASAFGMKVVGNDIRISLKNKYKWINFVTLNNLLKNSDYITIHTPLDETTRNLIDSDNINLINRYSIVLNCARGGIINENALYRALKRGEIAYAGIDVFCNEPDIDFRFAGLKNVLLTPHIAGKTKESYKRMALQAAEILIKFFK